jgi:hypothetical protein
VVVVGAGAAATTTALGATVVVVVVVVDVVVVGRVANVVADVVTEVLRPIAFVAKILTAYVLAAVNDERLNSSLPSERTVGLTVSHVEPSSVEYLYSRIGDPPSSAGVS